MSKKDKPIQFDSQDTDIEYITQLITIKRIRQVRDIADIQHLFPKELKNLALDELDPENLSIPGLLQKMQQTQPNSLILADNSTTPPSYLVVNTEINLSSHIAMRGNRLLTTGNHLQCAAAILSSIHRSYPGKYRSAEPKDIDQSWLQSFTTLHHHPKDHYKIIDLQ